MHALHFIVKIQLFLFRNWQRVKIGGDRKAKLLWWFVVCVLSSITCYTTVAMETFSSFVDVVVVVDQQSFFFCEVKEIPIVIKITTRVINLCVAAFSGVLRNSNLHKFHVFCFDACFLISFWNAHSYIQWHLIYFSLSLFYFSITFSFVAVVVRLNFINQQQSHFSS